MKEAAFCIAVAYLLCLSPALSFGEGLGQQPGTPGSASVSITTGASIKSGDPVPFVLAFDIAPQGYGGGRVIVEIAFEGDAPLGYYFDKWQKYSETEIPLQDGQRVSSGSISGLLQPGKWKIQSITIGRSRQRPIPIPNDATFEVAPPPSVPIRVERPPSVVAGRQFQIKVEVGPFPRGLDPSCNWELSGQIRSVPFGNTSVPIYLSRSPVSEQSAKELWADIPSDSETGQWAGTVRLSGNIPLYHDSKPCSVPTQGNQDFTFTVLQSPTLVTPTSAAVKLNPSQVELFRSEADRLKARAKDLAERFGQGGETGDQELLLNSLREALTDVNTTEARFKEKGTSAATTYAVGAFFDDIRTGYGETLQALGSYHSAYRSRPRAPIVHAVSFEAAGPPEIAVALDAVRGSLLHNAGVYTLAADTGSLTFTLEVYSTPENATISYRQRGDKQYRFVGHPTDWRIENLPIGVWLIRVQKEGYEDKELPFDAAMTSGTSIKLVMERKARAR